MMSRHIHIIGAGMSGLSAALQLSLTGEKVTVYEAAPFAGGRCRSFLDRELGCRIDNGNHLVFSGNAAVQDYLYLSGASNTMGGSNEPFFPFIDLTNGKRWTIKMNKGAIPWWIFNKSPHSGYEDIRLSFGLTDHTCRQERYVERTVWK